MIVEKTMEGQPEAFFDFLIESTLDDILTSSGKKVEKEDIKEGFSYKKNIANKKKTSAKATITKCLAPMEYVMKIKSENGTTTLSYKLKKDDDSYFTVKYSETYQSATNKTPGKLTTYFHDRQIKKKTLAMLNAIQKNINS